MGLSRQEALRLNHDYIGTEHILLGLIQDGSGVASDVLRNLDVDLRRVRNAVEKRMESGASLVTTGPLPFTPASRRVLECAYAEATDIGHNHIGTEHLLLGLILEGNGIAAQVLAELEIRMDHVRSEVLELVGADEPVTARRFVRLDGLDDERVPEGCRGAVSRALKGMEGVRSERAHADVLVTFAPEDSPERAFRAGVAAARDRDREVVLLVPPGGKAWPLLASRAAVLELDDELEANLRELLESAPR